MSTPETVCRTCGGSPGHHVPSVLDPNGIGDPGHRIPAQGSETAMRYGIDYAYSDKESPAGAEQGAVDPSIPPTPAGEGEQLVRILADHDNRQIALTDLDNWQEPHTQEAIAQRMADNTMQTLAAINAYIARRVLEELEDMTRHTSGGGDWRRYINQRIAVIKKESQQ